MLSLGVASLKILQNLIQNPTIPCLFDRFLFRFCQILRPLGRPTFSLPPPLSGERLRVGEQSSGMGSGAGCSVIQGVRLRRRNSSKLSKKFSKILFCSILIQILFNFLRPFGSKRLLRRRALPRKGHSLSFHHALAAVLDIHALTQLADGLTRPNLPSVDGEYTPLPLRAG